MLILLAILTSSAEMASDGSSDGDETQEATPILLEVTLTGMYKS